MLELLRLGLIDVIAHPEKMLDAEYDMFAPLVATVPAYAEYLRELEGATALAVDGKTRVSSIGAVRKEIYTPSTRTTRGRRPKPSSTSRHSRRECCAL